MANPNYVDPGLGPSPIQEMLTYTKNAPSDTTSIKAITQNMPLRHDRPSAEASGVGKGCIWCANNDIPEMFATQRQTYPNAPVGVIVVPRPIAGDPGAGKFVLRLLYSGNIPAITGGQHLGVLTDANMGIKLVATGGIGTVLWAEAGEALVQF